MLRAPKEFYPLDGGCYDKELFKKGYDMIKFMFVKEKWLFQSLLLDSQFWTKMELMYFSLCFLQSTKTLGLIHNSISNLWKHGEEKADWLGTLRSGERHNSDLSGFVFCFIYPGLGAGEVSSSVVPMDRQKEKKKKPSRNTGCIQLKDKERDS